MRIKDINFVGNKERKLYATIWMPEERPIAVVQIIHGMTEHIGRYEKLAKLLTNNGIVVSGFDIAGHGKSSEDGTTASFMLGEWSDTLVDMKMFGQFLDKEFQNIPRFALGFSLGSFLLREYLYRYENNLAGCVLIGTGYQPTFIINVIMNIVDKEIDKYGFCKNTPLIDKLSFETYNKKFKPNKTPMDWLCSDEDELDKYIKDPLCKKNISAGLFFQLLDGMKVVGDKAIYKRYNKDMPILLLSGKDDSVGNDGKGVEKVYKTMIKSEMKDIEMKLFESARHDLLHEEENGYAKEARQMILSWLLKKYNDRKEGNRYVRE